MWTLIFIHVRKEACSHFCLRGFSAQNYRATFVRYTPWRYHVSTRAECDHNAITACLTGRQPIRGVDYRHKAADRQLLYVVDNARAVATRHISNLASEHNTLDLHYCVGDIIMLARSNSSSLHALSAMYPGAKSVAWRGDAIPQVGLDALSKTLLIFCYIRPKPVRSRPSWSDVVLLGNKSTVEDDALPSHLLECVSSRWHTDGL
jgi:hypothetical protein